MPTFGALGFVPGAKPVSHTMVSLPCLIRWQLKVNVSLTSLYANVSLKRWPTSVGVAAVPQSMRVSVISAGVCPIAGRPMRTMAHRPTANRIVTFRILSPFFAMLFSLSNARTRLPLLRGPAVRPGACAAHQHGPFTIAQAGGVAEGLDGLLVVDHGEGARPVRTPEATREAPRVEHAGERVPDVREGVRLPG